MNGWTRFGGIASTLAAAALALGCLGRSPATHHYTLRPVGGGATAISELSIGLGPVTFPKYLERPSMVIRRGESEIRIDELHRWAGGFEPNVIGALADDLGARLGTDRVFLDPAASPFPVAFQVAVDFHQFEAHEGDAVVVLRARWVIRERSGEERAWTRETTIRQDLPGDSIEDLVAAHDTALARLADVIAGQITSAR